MIDDDVETGSMGPYQERPRIFPNMRSKPYNPLVRNLMLHLLFDDNCYCFAVRGLCSIDMRAHIFRVFKANKCSCSIYTLAIGFGGISYIGARTSPIMVFVFAVCIFSFLLSIYLTKWVLSKDEGPPEMVQISDAVRDGAEGFFRAQYSTISKMALLLSLVILCIYLLRSTTPQQESSGLGRSTSACITVAAFLLGALCSGVAGYVGMWVSIRANVRVSSAARRAAREALQLLVLKVTDLPLLLVGCGFGASFVALFAQLGGGIYTKAADVGADLVGRVEQGIPEDDPRNPAVIADLVGDNVGDCAAREQNRVALRKPDEIPEDVRIALANINHASPAEHVETGQSSTHSDGLNSRHVDGYISWKPIYRVIDSPGRITEADALSTDKSRLQVQSGLSKSLCKITEGITLSFADDGDSQTSTRKDGSFLPCENTLQTTWSVFCSGKILNRLLYYSNLFMRVMIC
ncbi:K(+)-INSENSITIVE PYROPHOSPHATE-ENERGIZED PROTON PUMP [Salix viminalis]|uniref:H(+)-exporting diphosphatase n=1 Tax=Salix viminalis TaxID=40686 RepID=A0A9Q0NVH9_SALVM|nr:K(+)-INSENSITIVE PYROPHOSPHATE-ENERGIZED PROTON PUMP [Salix viminalis]